MRVIDFDGVEHILKLTGKTILNNDIRPKSELHLQARDLLKQLYPFDAVYEEVHLPIGLYLDFFIPSKRLAVETNGKQHDEFVPHFHRNLASFKKSQTRDRQKQEFCTINNIRLVSLNYSESVERWIDKIRNAV